MLDVAFLSREQEVHRSRCARSRLTERLPDQIGQPAHTVYLEIRLGDLIERRIIIDFLIIQFMLLVAQPSSRERNDRAVRHVSVAQTGRKIRSADGLGGAYAGTPRSARISVRHVDGSLFAMGQHALDRHGVHLRERAAQNRRNEKEGAHAMSVQKISNEPAARYLWQSQFPPEKSSETTI